MKQVLGGAIVLGLLLVGCDGESDPSDGGMIDGGPSAGCASAADCDDGLFCNGAERCLPSDPGADAEGCVPSDAPACTDGCDEEGDACLGCATPDADGDGVDSIACGGDDCDDEDPGRFPGNVEICDEEGVDEDCDEATLGPDLDGDGFAAMGCCNGESCGRDCDDTRAGVNPSASDACGGGDQDCDGRIDEEPDSVFFRDQDSDNFGVDDDTLAACSQPPGYVARGGDCNDDPFVDPDANRFNPGVTEICNELDDDCDLSVDENLTCSCTVPGEERPCGFDPSLDGIGICRLGTQMCTGGMFTTCAGATPPMDERCNLDDDNCNGEVDEGVRPTCWLDPDGDGFAVLGAAEMTACECPSSHTDVDPATSEDCVEGEPEQYPGAPELCNRRDDDCSSGGGLVVAEDQDDDGHTSMGFTNCSGGFPRDDCYDFDDRVFLGQTQFFGTGHCPPGTRPCNTGCIDGLAVCFGTTPGPIAADRFDFNCNGSEEPRPRGTACEGCPAGFACGSAGGPAYGASPPACGALVSTIRCSSGACTATCSAGSNQMLPMPCR